MNLYLIEQCFNDGIGTYDAAVIAAPDEETARNMDPEYNKPIDWSSKVKSWHWAIAPNQVSVTYLGVAKPGTPQGVICASFNAG